MSWWIRLLGTGFLCAISNMLNWRSIKFILISFTMIKFSVVYTEQSQCRHVLAASITVEFHHVERNDEFRPILFLFYDQEFDDAVVLETIIAHNSPVQANLSNSVMSFHLSTMLKKSLKLNMDLLTSKEIIFLPLNKETRIIPTAT